MPLNEKQHISTPGANAKPDPHRVLVVDDEPAICFAYSRLLENERFGFDVCESIEEAISLIKLRQYFAVISDVRFAGSDNADGVYLATEIKREQPEAKIILVTGYGSDELKKTAAKLGICHYLEKPVEPSIILSLLRTLHLIADEQEEDEYYKSMYLDKAEV